MRFKTNIEPSPDPMQKLMATSPDNENDSSRSRYRRVKTFSKRVSELLAFHLLNVVVSIGGVISVALLLGSVVLMPCWFAALMIVVLAMSLVHAVQLISPKCLLYFSYVVLTGVYIVSLSVNAYVTLGPYVLLGVGTVGVSLFFISTFTMTYLLKADVYLADFVNPNSKNDTSALDPEKCMDRFIMSESTDTSFLLPHLRMTRRLWVVALYFTVFKIVVGVLSAAVVFFTVIQPALLIFSNGDALFFASRVNNDVEYVILMVSIWIIGAVGMPMVAAASAKLTSCICTDSGTDIGESLKQQDTEAAIPVTPELESSAICFTEIESAPPVVSSASL
ncbi:hypothetical protein PRIC1_001008 [Phytophthora ramorum]